ncbi:MAG: zinc-binding dehydrogenase [Alphaproteobacteria bacterium]|nr:zinc-binding dehydrogenase [Alphaproteobacteria bacterium]
MKAVVLHEHGQMDKLIYEENFPDPECGPEDVIVGVKATSLNFHDLFTRNGMPGITLNLPIICGLDVAGEIIETGSAVKDWSVGDAVLIDPRNRVEGGLVGETIHGGLAEFCRARAHQLIKIPDGVPFEQAASLPVAYGTAHRMMVTRGQVNADDKVLILGASGGVGTGAVLIAKIFGAEIVACGSTEAKLDALRELGATHVINYQEPDFVKEIWSLYEKPHRREYKGGVTMVVNFTGGETWVKSMRCLRRGGRLLTCGATESYNPPTDLRYVWSFEFDIRGSNSWEKEDLISLLDYVANGKMEVPIAGSFPLTQATEALRLIEDREVIGKVIVTP